MLTLSPEVLRTIVLHALDDRPCGPPHEWFTLIVSCRTLQRQLDTPAMHALLFAAAFHVPATARPTLSTHAKTELTRRFTALKFLKRGASCLEDSEEDSLTDALWVAYVMLRADLAEPRQMNVDQLLWAGVPDLLLQFLKRRLDDGAHTNHGWPLCNQVNSLVIALTWLLSSEASVKAESPATRDQVMERIRPYVLAAFRYPLSPQEWYDDPASSNCTRAFKNVDYFGSKRTMIVPSAPIYAILCYFTRLDTLVPMFPGHLQRPSRALSTRSKSKVGPTREAVEHFINECRTQFESWTPACSRLRTTSDSSAYLCGSLTGRWKGSSIVPYVNEYRRWQADLKKPESMDTFCRQPLYITLREHFYCSLEVEPPRIKSSPHSWLPASWEEHDNGITVVDDSTNCKRFYRTRLDGKECPENIVDVLITGQTDDPYATAWGSFKIFGRVRLSDGLVFLRRESVAGLGTTLLRGFLSSPNNFAGRYRALNVEAEVAEWEASFSLCKMEES